MTDDALHRHRKMLEELKKTPGHHYITADDGYVKFWCNQDWGKDAGGAGCEDGPQVVACGICGRHVKLTWLGATVEETTEPLTE